MLIRFISLCLMGRKPGLWTLLGFLFDYKQRMCGFSPSAVLSTSHWWESFMWGGCRSQAIRKYGIRSVLQATWSGLASAKRSGIASDNQLDLFRSADHLFQVLECTCCMSLSRILKTWLQLAVVLWMHWDQHCTWWASTSTFRKWL